ncbi:MAG: hypothetical protein ABFD84_04875 [Candidatus Polarisedimenticolia bacterium]|nr:hypothetical protein [bacterium]
MFSAESARRGVVALLFLGSALLWASTVAAGAVAGRAFLPLLVPVGALAVAVACWWTTVPASVFGIVYVAATLCGRADMTGLRFLLLLFFSLIAATEVLRRVRRFADSPAVRWVSVALPALLLIGMAPSLVAGLRDNLRNAKTDLTANRVASVTRIPALEREDGRPISLNAHGKIFQLYLWSKRCVPCQQGLSKLGDFWSRIQMPSDVQIVAVPVEVGVRNPASLPPGIARARDVAAWAEDVGIGAVPKTIFVKDGLICGKSVGFSERTEEKWVSLIERCRTKE